MDDQLKGDEARALDAARLSWPMDWPGIFRRQAPLYLEIGFGNGQFLVDLALQNREANILGVEISLPSIRKAERKIQNQGLSNLRVVHGDVRLLLWGGFSNTEAEIEKVYINFPDPWHKAAHNHRKLINPRFLHLLGARMIKGGTLDIATDDAGYQAVIAAALAETPYFNSRSGQPWVTEDIDRIRTKYELKALAEGRVCHYYHWLRNQEDVSNRFPTPKELDMPHAIIKTSLSFEQIVSKYAVTSFSGDTPVRLLHLFEKVGGNRSETGRDGLLVEAHVAEDPLPQRIGMTVHRRAEDELIIGLHELGFPRPTQGVHLAVAHLARFLLSLDSKAHIQHHNLNVELQRRATGF